MRVKFVLTVEDGRVRDVEYTAARCKTLRGLGDRLKEALLGVEEGRIGEVVRRTLEAADLPENRENRRRLLLKAFGLSDG